MWSNPQLPMDLVTFTEKILNVKLQFLWSVGKNQSPTLIQFSCMEWNRTLDRGRNLKINPFTARFLKHVWPLYNIMRERVKVDS